MKTIVIPFGLLLLLTALLLFLSRPTPGRLDPIRQLNQTRLDPERQLVRVRLDSLTTLLRALPQGTLTWADETDRLAVRTNDSERLNAALFDHKSVATYASSKDSPVRTDGAGFSVPIEQKGEVRYVLLPADVLHSLQLYLHDQKGGSPF
jgi:hypothetical protein